MAPVLPFTSPPDSLCILRLSALGDVTHMLPVVHTLNTCWPGTRLTWIIGKTEARLLLDLPGVELLIFDKSLKLRAYTDLRRQLQGRRFDALLLMQVSLRANLAACLVDAPVKVGFDSGRARNLHRFVQTHAVPKLSDQHVVDGFFAFLETLGLTQRELRWNIPVPPAEQAFADTLLPGDQPTLLISPCSSHPLRNWPAERYARLAEYAVERHGLRVALIGGRSALETRYGAEIRQMARVPILDLIGKDTLKSLVALMRKARVVLTPDSGPAHIASAAGARVIALHAASNSRRSGPYLNLDYCVDRYDAAARRFLGKPAALLRWGTKIERAGVMDLITVADVIERLDASLQEGATPPER